MGRGDGEARKEQARHGISLGTVPPACRTEWRDISWEIDKPPNYSPT